jgi:TonB family protein
LDPTPPPLHGDPGGGGEPYKLDEDASRDGVGQRGRRTTDRIGPGGTGTGTGSGSGSGSAVEAVRPVSVATIKTAAKPKGDFAYFDDAKRYPEEAKQLGIEGAIKVQLIVDETGKIKRTRLLTKLGHGLDELALEHAGQLAFEPARDTDDRPVASVVVWTFHMTLPK